MVVPAHCNWGSLRRIGGFILVLLFCHAKLRALVKNDYKNPFVLVLLSTVFLMPFYPAHLEPSWEKQSRSAPGRRADGGRRVSVIQPSIAVSSLSFTWPQGSHTSNVTISVLGRLTWCFSPFLGRIGNWKRGPSAQNRPVFGWCWCCFGLIT